MLLTLPIGDISENTVALRTEVDKECLAYQELKSQIADVGLLSPISVRRFTDPETLVSGYKLVDGLHRLTACQDLGHTVIDVKVITLDDSRVLAAQIMGNSRVNTTKTQFANGIKQLMQHNVWTTERTAKEIGKSNKFVKDMLGISSLPAKVKELVDSGKICAANASILAKLPKERLDEEIQYAITQSPSDFCPRVEELIKNIKASTRTGKKVVATFVERAKVRNTSELTSLIEEFKNTGTVQAITTLVAAAEDKFSAALEVLKFVLQLDPVSVAGQKAKWDAIEAQKAADKKKKEDEKAAKNQALVATLS